MERKVVVFIAILFVVWRLFLFLPLFASEKYLAYRSGYEYTSLAKAAEPGVYKTLHKFYLAPWANFDGLHYLFIAGNGYTNNMGFFPLYPLAIKLFSTVLFAKTPFDISYFFSAFLISNVAFFASLVVFYKLLSLDYKEKQTKQMVLAMLVFPTSFFLGSLYSESLFLLFLFLSFYFARKKRWFLASFFGLLLSLTRLVGIFIFPTLIYEYLKEEKRSYRELFQSGLWLAPVGLIGYSIYNYILKKDFLYFIHAQGNFLNNRSVTSIVLFPQTVFRYVKILSSLNQSQFEWWIALLELGSFIFAAVLLYIAWKKKVRLSYILFSSLAVLIPASSGTFTALPRYILVAFPIYIVVGLIKNKYLKIVYFVVSTVLLFIFTFFFSKGYFIS